MDNHIDKYRVQGRIYIWQYVPYNRNYPGWNLTADQHACDSLIDLLGLMRSSAYPSRKTIQTVQPTEKVVSVANRSNGYNSKPRLSLKYNEDAPVTWKLDDSGDELLVTFNSERIIKLQAALQKVKLGEGDFAVADDQDENILYFWWNLEK